MKGRWTVILSACSEIMTGPTRLQPTSAPGAAPSRGNAPLTGIQSAREGSAEGCEHDLSYPIAGASLHHRAEKEHGWAAAAETPADMYSFSLRPLCMPILPSVDSAALHLDYHVPSIMPEHVAQTMPPCGGRRPECLSVYR